MNWQKFVGLTLVLLGSSAITQADTLRDIYELSLKSDPLIRAAEAEYRANLETEKLSRAALLPQINARYEFNDTEQDRDSNSINFDSNTGKFGPIQTSSTTKTENAFG